MAPRRAAIWNLDHLIGGDVYTAFTMIAVPAIVYAAGAYGFFALPYTMIVYPFVFAIMPVLWTGRQGPKPSDGCGRSARPLCLAPARTRGSVTGVLATMPYIALQLIGMETIIRALGLEGEIPLVAAFLILPHPRIL